MRKPFVLLLVALAVVVLTAALPQTIASYIAYAVLVVTVGLIMRHMYRLFRGTKEQVKASENTLCASLGIAALSGAGMVVQVIGNQTDGAIVTFLACYMLVMSIVGTMFTTFAFDNYSRADEEKAEQTKASGTPPTN